MMSRFGTALVGMILLVANVVDTAEDGSVGAGGIQWHSLPKLPDDHGLAGPFAGKIGGSLVVAGGANFPEAPPWEGGKKVWHDRIFVYSTEQNSWMISEMRLPQPLAYGVSLTLPGRASVVVLGGSDQENVPTTTALELRLVSGNVTLTELPSLPVPLAEMSGEAIGNTLYLFSGRTSGKTSQTMFQIDLDAIKPQWKALPWPGEARGAHAFHCGEAR